MNSGSGSSPGCPPTKDALYARDGTWDRILQEILADADAAGMIDWNVSVDATI